MRLQLIKNQVTDRVTMIGDWIADRQVIAPLVGSRYLYENRTPPGAAVGTIYHNAGEGELYVNSQDLDGNNHYNAIGSLKIGDKLTVGTQTEALILRPAYVGGGLWQLFFASWPPLVNGEYLVTVARESERHTQTLQTMRGLSSLTVPLQAMRRQTLLNG